MTIDEQIKIAESENLAVSTVKELQQNSCIKSSVPLMIWTAEDSDIEEIIRSSINTELITLDTRNCSVKDFQNVLKNIKGKTLFVKHLTESGEDLYEWIRCELKNLTPSYHFIGSASIVRVQGKPYHWEAGLGNQNIFLLVDNASKDRRARIKEFRERLRDRELPKDEISYAYIATLITKKINDYIALGNEVTKPLIVWLSFQDEISASHYSSSFDFVLDYLTRKPFSDRAPRYCAYRTEGHPFKQGWTYFIDSDNIKKRISDHPEMFENFMRPNYRSDTDYFLYYRYVDQLNPEHLAYCQDLIDNLHMPVVCLLVDVEDKKYVTDILGNCPQVDFHDLYKQEMNIG